MTRHVVIGTAGHVDHGKTALVKALTGVDTDRWEEEKRRGITIDLGFADMALGEDCTASIVDVPGHEDFVRNMVAGATGIDAALLVVAADEGVMPQTTEHLAILEFLAVTVGVAVVTKCDLAERDWLDLVEDDLRERLRASPVDWQHVVRASAQTGEGIESLRTALAEVAHRVHGRAADDVFRLPIDRVFSIAGAGTVVTGTTWSGSVRVGDEIRILPVDLRARVRGVEVHGRPHDAALPGRRTALALAGIDRERIGRGQVVVAGNWWQSTSAVDAIVSMLPGARPLSQRSRVRVHLGTSEVMARVTPGDGTVGPGSTGAVRLRLETPVVCRWGDRGVLRSYSPVTTIGGITVVDPWPPARPRRPVRLEDRADASAERRLPVFVALAGMAGLRPAELPVRLGVPPVDVETLLGSVPGVVAAPDRLVAAQVVEQAARATREALGEYHQTYPLEPGMPRELLRQALDDPGFSDFVVGRLQQEGAVMVEGQTVRLADHEVELSEAREAEGRVLLGELARAGGQGRTLDELSETAGSGSLRELLEYYVRQGAAVRVGRDRYYDREVLDGVARTVLERIREEGRATPAQLRERTGLTRKYLIPLLEWMDGRGLTVRQGDARGLGAAGEAYLKR